MAKDIHGESYPYPDIYGEKWEYYVVSDLTIGHQSGTANTLYATWKWSHPYTQTHLVTWKYYTGDGVWFVDNESEVPQPSTGSAVTITYSPPANAIRVSCTVLPVAYTYQKYSPYNQKGGTMTYEAPRWKAKATTEYLNLSDIIEPEKPSTPTVTIDGSFDLTAGVSVTDKYTQYIEFEVVKNDKTTVKTGQTKVTKQYAAFKCKVAAGGKYKVRCRALRTFTPSGLPVVYPTYVSVKSPRTLTSDWSDYSSNVETVPTAPTSITRHKVETATSLWLYWKALNPTPSSYTVEYAKSKNFFDSSSVTQTITVVSPQAYIEGLDSGTTWYFRVKATNDQGDSGWSEVYSVILGVVPAAPTTWSETSTGIVGDSIRLYWVHNAEDGSTQSEAQVQVKIDNGSWVNYAPTYKSETQGEASYLNYNTYVVETSNLTDSSNNDVIDDASNTIIGESHIDYPEGMVIRWRVRTRGVLTTGGESNNGFSPWSVERVVVMYAPPSIDLTITSIKNSNTSNYIYFAFPIYIYAEAHPSTQTPVGWNISIIANESYQSLDDVGQRMIITAGDEIFSEYITGGTHTMEAVLNASDVDFENEKSYTVKVTVSMSSGLKTEAQQTIITNWASRNLWPNAEIAIDSDSLCAYIRPFCVNDDNELAENVTLTVCRREYDGRFVTIQEDIPNDMVTVITDPHPSLNYARYRIIATSSETGQIGFYDLPGEKVGETGIVIQWDEEWSNFDVPSGDSDGIADPAWVGSMLKLPYNIKVSESTSIDKSLVEYIGRSAPVSYYGTQLGVSGSWSSEIPATDIETVYALRRLQIYRGDAYVREPNGVGYWASINITFNKDYDNLLIPISIDVTRVEGGI